MKQTVRAIVVDDEPLAVERIRRLLAGVDSVSVVATCCDGESAISAVLREQPDLVFLDVQMPRCDGFDVARALADRLPVNRLPALVFVTAYDQYAVRAFETQAIDYLVKPFADDRFLATIERVRWRLQLDRLHTVGGQLLALLDQMPEATGHGPEVSDVPDAAAASGTGRLERLLVRTGSRSRVLRTDAVDWIEADGVYARLHVGRTSCLIRMPMHQLEAQLDSRTFVRIHRSTLVNLERVKEVHEVDRRECFVVLADGSRLKLSRSRRAHFESVLGHRL